MPMSSLYMDRLEQTSLNCKLAVAAGNVELVSKYNIVMKKRMELEKRLVEKLGRC